MRTGFNSGIHLSNGLTNKLAVVSIANRCTGMLWFHNKTLNGWGAEIVVKKSQNVDGVHMQRLYLRVFIWISVKFVALIGRYQV